jgi:hypothetical protein
MAFSNVDLDEIVKSLQNVANSSEYEQPAELDCNRQTNHSTVQNDWNSNACRTQPYVLPLPYFFIHCHVAWGSWLFLPG